jgi:phage replication O-like protein O
MKVRPFSGQGGYTVFDNIILDYIMPELSPAAWKVLCYIIRKTIGWHQESDKLSYSRIMAGTGIKSRPTISKVLGELEEHGFVVVTRPETGDFETANSYQLNTSLELEIDGGSIKNTLPPSAENIPGGSLENEHNKINHINKIPPRVRMINALVDATGMSGVLNYAVLSELADELIGASYSHEDVVVAFCSPNGYWRKADWRGQRGDFPDPKHIRECIRRGLEWERRKSAPSPETKLDRGDTAVWGTALTHARRGDSNFADPALKAAVRVFGWPKLQAIKPGDENFYRKEFLRIYNDQLEPAST